MVQLVNGNNLGHEAGSVGRLLLFFEIIVDELRDDGSLAYPRVSEENKLESVDCCHFSFNFAWLIIIIKKKKEST